MKPDNLRITPRGLWEKIGIGSHEIGEFHIRFVGVTARAQHVAFEIDRGGVIRSDREDVNFVSILHRKAAQFGADRIGIAGFSDLDA